MALMQILKKYSFVQAPETEVSGHYFYHTSLSLSSQTTSHLPGLADVISIHSSQFVLTCNLKGTEAWSTTVSKLNTKI